MSITNNNMDISATSSPTVDTLMEAVNNIFTLFMMAQATESSKIKHAINALPEEPFQTALRTAIETNIPKTPKTVRARKANTPKDPDAPKKGCTSYIKFSNEMRAQVKEDNPDMKGKDIIKELGRLWRTGFAKLDKKTIAKLEEDGITFTEKEMEMETKKRDKARAKYEKLAEEDKKRYEAEMKEYTPLTEDEIVAKLEASGKKIRKRGSPKKNKRDPNKPKGKKSAYLAFCSAMRTTMKEESGLDSKELTSALGELWNMKYAHMDDKFLKELAKKHEKKPVEAYAELLEKVDGMSEKKLAKFMKKANKSRDPLREEFDNASMADKERFDREMKSYSPLSSPKNSPKSKRGSPKKAVPVNVDSDSDSDEDHIHEPNMASNEDDSNEESAPKTLRRSPRHAVVSIEEAMTNAGDTDIDLSDSDEEKA